MTKILKIIALAVISAAGLILTGIGNSILVQPEIPLPEFIFLSSDTLTKHLPIGIAAALILYFFIKQSIKILFSIAFILLLVALCLFYFI